MQLTVTGEQALGDTVAEVVKPTVLEAVADDGVGVLEGLVLKKEVEDVDVAVVKALAVVVEGAAVVGGSNSHASLCASKCEPGGHL